MNYVLGPPGKRGNCVICGTTKTMKPLPIVYNRDDDCKPDSDTNLCFNCMIWGLYKYPKELSLERS